MHFYVVIEINIPNIDSFLTDGHAGKLPEVPMSIGAPCYSMYVVYSTFLMFKHWFCWKYHYNKYMFNFIDIYICIPVSGCVGRGCIQIFNSNLMCNLINVKLYLRGNQTLSSSWSNFMFLYFVVQHIFNV
jgi:hypothetical protein